MSIKLTNEDVKKLANLVEIPEEMQQLSKEYVDGDNESSDFLRGVTSGLAHVMSTVDLNPHERFMLSGIIQECVQKVLEKDAEIST